MPTHLRPTRAIAARALLPTDPGVALALAQALLEQPLMANHARGLWGYTGTAADGEPLTVQSIGTGGPVAALVLGELAAVGLRTAVLLGEATGLPAGARVGERVHVGTALGLDGTSHALGAEDLAADPALAGPGVVVSVDVAPEDAPTGGGASCSDLTTAGLLAAARRAGVRAGGLLVVVGDDAGSELDDPATAEAFLAAGRAGAALLGVPERDRGAT